MTGSFGPGSFKYQAFTCYDLNNGAQELDQFGVWTADLSVHVLLLLPISNSSLATQRPGTASSREDLAKCSLDSRVALLAT